ncbi:TPA: adenylate/guanylate cyclase domain-containing protein [Bacillus cereus]|uniref:adenylate/guanylate cyclase domain-containing protein n=1 Tax=Bacillus cereus TaxID=1396 RepID=UPI000BF993D5|nr:adenylate/guanylate cyclase domain-containing protein [Bacillus cereus]PFL47418.1 adenylate/guanylate cyclase domain-containing protein [Bacillus cereus]PFQ99270.1 adenylate/guanylate cyclase domain-containing protein [Bacillus cereus]PGY81751.1 adenylate/guanylate cyclase domain-containing protein [Bacillus cereus]
MKSNHQSFNFEKSLSRIDDILDNSATYEEADDIPDVTKLTYTNGKYVKCAAFFIDLRGSTDLIKTKGRKSKTLARLYRAYISEIVAIVNSFKTCKEINIVGDCVSAMFSGKADDSDPPVIEALQAASMSNAMMAALNVKYKKKWGDEFQEIKAGIGVALGRALVIKAGFNGSGISDLIYMGDVVNRASKMCGLANKEYTSPICVTENVYASAGTYIANSKTQETFQDFLTERYHTKHGTIYTGNFHRLKMQEWADDNK